MSWFLDDMVGMKNWFLSGFNHFCNFFVRIWNSGFLKCFILFILVFFFFCLGLFFVCWLDEVEKQRIPFFFLSSLCFCLSLFFFLYFLYCVSNYNTPIFESTCIGDTVVHSLIRKGGSF